MIFGIENNDRPIKLANKAIGHTPNIQLTKLHIGAALMALWSYALSLTASCLSPMPEFEYRSPVSVVACEKVSRDLWLGGHFCQVLRFPPPLTTG